MEVQELRIAYPMRIDATDKPGGDLFQIQKYIDAGRKMNRAGQPRFDGTVLTAPDSDLSKFDLVHLTNIDRPVDTYRSFLSASAQNKPILVSPIHHSYGEIERFEHEGRDGIAGHVSSHLGFRMLEYLRGAVRCIRYPRLISPTVRLFLKGMREAQTAILTGSRYIIVLTEKEKHDLYRDIAEVPSEKILRLGNGLEAHFPQGDAGIVRDIEVCVVGRIEARKNQIKVLQILKRLGIPGVFVGAENPNHLSYCRRFKSLLEGSGSTYLGGLSPEVVRSLMRRARVHISASWFEVLSMVDLEAYAAGCGVVASQCGGTREILGDSAEYVNPSSDDSIEKGISRIFERISRDPQIASRENECKAIAQTWDQIGEMLEGIYRSCIDADNQ